jgi:hypothetical protein
MKTENTLENIMISITGGTTGPYARSEAALRWNTLFGLASAPLDMATVAAEKLGCQMITDREEKANLENLVWGLSETVAAMIKTGYYDLASHVLELIEDADKNNTWKDNFDSIEELIFIVRRRAYEEGVLTGV